MDEKIIKYSFLLKTFVDPSPQNSLIKMSNNKIFIPFHICFIDEESHNLKFSINDYLMGSEKFNMSSSQSSINIYKWL